MLIAGEKMLLSDKDIKDYIKKHRIKITPKPDFKTQLGSCSIDLRLSNIFKVFEQNRTPYIDVRQNLSNYCITRDVKIKKDEPFIMHPGIFVLAQTVESIELPDDIVARLEGRSSLGRLGIVVHSTAALFDAGFKGKPTLELGNLGKLPVGLYQNMRICALTFEQLSSKAEVPYYKKRSAKYLGKEAFSESKIGEEKQYARKI
ncbi:MAG: dCTP deaminase [Candidatus Berkelbacteria bacterium]|nr:dCTP deaminase [Candidatus Berkelbacteria bacterium]